METNTPSPTNLKAFRLSQGYSMEGFARKLGVSLNTVYRWESGKASPSHMAMRLLVELGFTS